MNTATAINRNNVYVQRRLKLEALRQGHGVIPDRWVDAVVEYRTESDSLWLGVRYYNRPNGTPYNSNDLNISEDDGGSLAIFGNDGSVNQTLGVDYPEVGAMVEVAEIIFMCRPTQGWNS
jgi:hypothetical protein